MVIDSANLHISTLLVKDKHALLYHVLRSELEAISTSPPRKLLTVYS
jgi:hypothetical protein